MVLSNLSTVLVINSCAETFETQCFKNSHGFHKLFYIRAMEKFRAYLQEEYLRRRQRNPSYSLRSFAKYLKVDAGSLSQYLNGRRNYSLSKLHHFALILGLEKDQLLTLLGQKSKDFEVVEFEKLHLLSKWYYPAILETMELKDFQQSADWIAKRLGLSVSIINVALNQMFAANVLILNPDGTWKNNWHSFTTQKNENVDEFPLRELQKQLLKLSEESIDNNPAEEKSHTAIFSAVDEAIVPEIKEEIKKFRRKIMDLIENKSIIKNSVYCMQINLFPETKGTGTSHD